MAVAQGHDADEIAVKAFTELARPVLCPEIKLRLKPSTQDFATFRDRLPPRLAAAPPYWAVAWPGGQALARFLLDNPILYGESTLDLGAGSGIAAIAAGLSGAIRVRAVDNDRFALAAIRVNAALNEVAVGVSTAGGGRTKLEGVHAVIAGDLWYDRFVAAWATQLLRSFARQGALVLAGDPGRSYFPRQGRRRLAAYQLPVSEELERGTLVTAHVWQLLP